VLVLTQDTQLQWGPLRTISPSLAELKELIATNDKQRFTMKRKPGGDDGDSTSPADWLIRANQGHSIKLESAALLKPIHLGGEDGGNVVPDVAVHGTYFAFWPAIVASGGLRPMGRTHVHCSAGLPDDADAGVVSGMRRDAELLIYIDVRRSLEDGALQWWRSDNGVVLTEGTPATAPAGEEEGGQREGGAGLVPLKYFKEVVGRNMDVGVLWKDGEKVADLPAHVKMSIPRGKEGRHRGGGGERRDRGGGGPGRGKGRGR